MGSLQAAFARNKKTIAIAGAGLVVVLALVARKRASSSTASSPAATTYGTGLLGSTTSSSTPYSTYTPYDSTGADVAGALQSNTEALQQLLASTPVPGQTTTPTDYAGYAPGYYKPGGYNSVYQLLPTGQLDWLSQSEYAALGNPTAQPVPLSNPLWKQPTVGNDQGLQKLVAQS